MKMQNRTTSLTLVSLAAAVFVCAAATSARAGVAADLCTGDPCVITGLHTIADSLDRVVIDFGNRAVVLTGTLDIGPNEVLLSARTFDISGEVRGEAGVGEDTGSLEMVADNIAFQEGSMVSLRAAEDGFGGTLDVFAFDSVIGDLMVDASGGFGGVVSLTAANRIRVVANLALGDLGDARFDAGCSLETLAGTTVTVVPDGSIQFFSAGPSTLAGIFDAGNDGIISASYRPDQNPPDTSGGTFNPQLTAETDEFLPACQFGSGPTPTPTITLTPTITPTSTPITPTPTTTPTVPPRPPCLGDCNGDGQVTVDEVIVMVNIALGNTEISACTAGDFDGGGEITVDEIVVALNIALDGCPI